MNVYSDCDLGPGGCPCPLHVTTDSHVPVCPVHGAPLVAGPTTGTAACVAVERHATQLSEVARRVVGFEVKRCRDDWPFEAWVWKRREVFADTDLPPHNGWTPPVMPDLPFEGRRW